MSGKNNPEYLQHHPLAVQDVDEARILADAGDHDETHAAALRHRAFEALGGGIPGTHEQFDHEFEAKVQYVELPEMYKQTEAMLDTYEDLGVKGLIKEIRQHQKEADDQYKFVGDAYRRLKRTKR